MNIKLGEKAPDFELYDGNNEKHSLEEFLGKWVLLYFYPKDDTPGCTKEACSIRDSWDDFKKNKIIVLGVSADSVGSHKKFQEKYDLPFTLLSDEEKSVIKKYGVWQKKKFMGKEYFGIARTSFLIDDKGHFAKIYEKVNPEKHASEIIMDYKALKQA